MSSELDFSSIRELILETEANLKKIECYNDDFVYVTLNEWRYAVRHGCDSLCGIDSEDNRNRAVNHLKRAYYDSFDILLDCLLARFQELHREYCDYTPVVRNYVPEYAEKLQRARKAQSLHATYRDSADRDSLYQKLKEQCAALESFIAELEMTADDWRFEIRRAKNRDRWAFVGILSAVLGAVCAIVALLV